MGLGLRAIIWISKQARWLGPLPSQLPPSSPPSSSSSLKTTPNRPQHHHHHQQLSGHLNRHKAAGKPCQVNYRHVHIPLLPLQCHSCQLPPFLCDIFKAFFYHFVKREGPKWSNLLKHIFNIFLNSFQESNLLEHIFDQAIKTKLLFRSRKMQLKLASEFQHLIYVFTFK